MRSPLGKTVSRIKTSLEAPFSLPEVKTKPVVDSKKSTAPNDTGRTSANAAKGKTYYQV